MLAFSRPGSVTLADHPLTELVDEALLLTQPRFKNKRVELVKQYHETANVRVDRQKILQVLINIINNAVDSLPTQGRIRVSTGLRMVDSLTGTNGADRYATVEVADNGVGIPAAVRARIFDPFFTTKREGTGLGLSISQKIVRDHGGVITVNSIEGKGTTFVVNLPVS
jgi:signal transduction histidine kinase